MNEHFSYDTLFYSLTFQANEHFYVQRETIPVNDFLNIEWKKFFFFNLMPIFH